MHDSRAILDHADFVRRIALALVRNNHDADDLLQETMVKALERTPSDPNHWTAWLRTVVKNAARKLRRSHQRRDARQRQAAQTEALSSADQVVRQRLLISEISRAIQSLAPIYADAVILRFYDDLPPREIADRLKVPVETVQTRLKRGLALIRRRLEEQPGGEARDWFATLLALAHSSGHGGLASAHAVRQVPDGRGMSANWTTKLLAGACAIIVAGTTWILAERATNESWASAGADQSPRDRVAASVLELDRSVPTVELGRELGGSTMETRSLRERVRSAALVAAGFALSTTAAPAIAPSGGTWTPLAPMPTARLFHATDVLNGQLYAISGSASTGPTTYGPTTSVEVYDPPTNTWSSGPAIPIALAFAGTGVIDGKIYVVGGAINADTNSTTNGLWSFDPVTGWVQHASMPTARFTMAVGVIQGKLYVAGGAAPFVQYDTLEIYDPTTDSWTTGPRMPTRSASPGGAVINDIFYVVGAVDAGGNPDALEAFDPMSNQWMVLPTMPTARSSLCVAALDGKLYAAGGENNSIGLTTVEVYDPVTATWSTDTSLPTPREYTTPRVINRVMYIAGGYSGTGPTADLDAFVEPTASTPPTANAGPDQSIHAGQEVHLDGSGSFDDDTPTPDLLYAWTITSKPTGSTASLSDAHAIAPSFLADLPGAYQISLVVTDSDLATSAPDLVLISSLNQAPSADAGADAGAIVGSVVALNGTGSMDPDHDTLTYSWVIQSKPTGSSAALANAGTGTPSFTPDVAGSYTIQLLVNDGFASSAPDTVVISAITPVQYSEALVMDAMNFAAGLPPSAVTNSGNQRAFGNFLNQVEQALQSGDNSLARQKLQDAIARTDGWALRGHADATGAGRDWITDQAASVTLYVSLTAALAAISP